MSQLIPVYTSPLGSDSRENYITYPPLNTQHSSHSSPISSSGIPKASYFKPDTTLSPEEQAFCRCVAHVEAKGTARNPYAVCAKSVGTTSRRCGQEYEFSNFPDSELIGYAEQHKISVPRPYRRQKMLENITAWKAQEKKYS